MAAVPRSARPGGDRQPSPSQRGPHEHFRTARGGLADRDGNTNSRPPNTVRLLSTETKAAFKTTEFFAHLAVLAGVLLAGAVIGSSDAGGYGARQVRLYATILTVGYMVSRGLAKPGSRDP